MSKLIKITGKNGLELYLNPMFIQTMCRMDKDNTEILLMSGDRIYCEETPAEIEKKSNEFTIITK
jgi:uncharacterized protein YlzI (FlbEa/FlbD family)